MTEIYNKYLQNFVSYCKSDEETLMEYLTDLLIETYGVEKIIWNSEYYIYAEGTIPIMLVAHMDTVFRNPPKKVFMNDKYIFSKNDEGIGADDRAGVSAIMSLIEVGYKPHVIFTRGEETGCVGARYASNELYDDVIKKDINIMIELDREGFMNYVTYDNENRDMEKYIEKFGFTKDYGSFSDITELGPTFDIASLNLGIGYYQQHTKYEYLDYNEYLTTIDIIEGILQNPPLQPLEHIEAPNRYHGYYGYSSGYTYQKEDNYLEGILDVEIDLTELQYYSYDFDNIDWEQAIQSEHTTLIQIAEQAIIQELAKHPELFTKYQRQTRRSLYDNY